MSIISEQMLRGLDRMIINMSKDQWDIPPQLFIVTDKGKLGVVYIDTSFFEQYPDPTDLINALADLQRTRVNELKQTDRSYLDEFPELQEVGKPVAVIGVVESWGMDREEYERGIRSLPPHKLHQLMTKHGYVPMQDLPNAREQRNIVAVDTDLKITMLTRYREPEEVEFVTEHKDGYVSVGRLNESLISFLGAILASYPLEDGTT